MVNLSKIIKILVLLLSFNITLLGSNLIIDDEEKSFEYFEMEFYEDSSHNLNLNQMKNLQQWQKIKNNFSLGFKDPTLWFRFSISNKTESVQTRILYLSEPNIDEIDIFSVNQNISENIFSGGVSRYNQQGVVDKSTPIITIEIASNETKTIYIKTRNDYHNANHIRVFTNKSFYEYSIVRYSLLYFYFGAITALLLYNLFLYLSLKDSNYLLYVLFVFFYGFSNYQLLCLYPLDTVPSPAIGYAQGSGHVFWFAFHTLFSRQILQIKDYYPKIDKFVLYNGYFLLALAFYALYDCSLALHIMNIWMLFLPLFILGVAIALYFRKNKLASYYIVAQTLFISSSIIFGLLFAAVLEYNYFTRYINLVGSLSEIILFSLALAYRTQLIRDENEKNNQLLNEYSKLSFIGQTMLNISHQWKSPINNIFNSINHIEVARQFNEQNLDKVLDKNLSNIKQTTLFLKDTALGQLDFYKSNTKKEKINLYDEINFIIKLIKSEFSKRSIDVILDFDKSFEFTIKKNYFLNVLMILFENSYKLFEQRNIKNPFIKIEVLQDKNSFELHFEDNAQGAKDDIDKIFDKSYSITHSSGLGLYLAKEIVEYKLKGSITAQNKDKGVLFVINIPFPLSSTNM
jgi:two-component system, sensor histidine kinase LadS